jgi:excisionase family DNA binding protein
VLDPNDLLTPDELAARLKVHKSWVFEKTRRRCSDPLPCIRVGRYLRFNWPDVVEWLKPN